MIHYGISGVGHGGAGVQAHPEKYWFVKNLGKCGQESFNIF